MTTIIEENDNLKELATAIPYSLWQALKEDDLKGDPWGTVMSWLFALADYMMFFKHMKVPTEWEYQPSPFGPTAESFQLKELRRRNDSKGTLERFGKLLWAMCAAIKRQGRDY